MTAFRILRKTATVVAFLWFGVVASAETLTVVSWGGSYEQASRKAILEPFSKETGIDIRVETYNGGLAQVRAQVETGKVYWDVVDFEMADASGVVTRDCWSTSMSTISRLHPTAPPQPRIFSRER